MTFLRLCAEKSFFPPGGSTLEMDYFIFFLFLSVSWTSARRRFPSYFFSKSSGVFPFFCWTCRLGTATQMWPSSLFFSFARADLDFSLFSFFSPTVQPDLASAGGSPFFFFHYRRFSFFLAARGDIALFFSLFFDAEPRASAKPSFSFSLPSVPQVRARPRFLLPLFPDVFFLSSRRGRKSAFPPFHCVCGNTMWYLPFFSPLPCSRVLTPLFFFFFFPSPRSFSLPPA